MIGVGEAVEFADNSFNVNNSNNLNNGSIVFMDMPRQESSGKEGVRVSVKDTQRRSAACLLCRNRKRKCDGQDPCSYCVSKNWTCSYTQQKKRGPQKKGTATAPGEQMQVVSPSTIDCEMLDQIEAQTFSNYYLKYINQMIPMTTRDKMLHPSTAAHKVQSYSALAYTARICGDPSKASKYISQARLTAGDIYDSPDADSVSALLMMSNYWQLVMNIPLCAHYSRLAHSLRRLMPQNSLEYRVDIIVEVSNILCDESTSNKKKAKQLRSAAANVLAQPQTDFLPLMASFLTMSSYILGCLDHNPIFLKKIQTSREFFLLFSNITIDEHTRLQVLKEVNNVSILCATIGACGIDIHLHTLITVFSPMYMSLVEWRSGHLQEALNYGISTLQGLTSLEKQDAFGFACGVVDFPHVVMIGAVCQLFRELGQFSLAAQLCGKIQKICKLLTPELDFVLAYTEEFMSWLPANAQLSRATITVLDENANNNAIPSPTPNNSNANINTNTNTNSATNNMANVNMFSSNNNNTPIQHNTHYSNVSIANNQLFNPTTYTAQQPSFNFTPAFNPNSAFNGNNTNYNANNFNTTTNLTANSLPNTNTNLVHSNDADNNPYNWNNSPSYANNSPNYVNSSPSQSNSSVNNSPGSSTYNTPNENADGLFYVSEFGTTQTNKIFYYSSDNVASVLDLNTSGGLSAAINSLNHPSLNNPPLHPSTNPTSFNDTVTLIDNTFMSDTSHNLTHSNENSEPNVDPWPFIT